MILVTLTALLLAHPLCINGNLFPTLSITSSSSSAQYVESQSSASRPSIPMPVCSENSHWTSCAAKCQATCQNPSPGLCQWICTPACQCNFGYVRNQYGDCVPRSDCSKKFSPPRFTLIL